MFLFNQDKTQLIVKKMVETKFDTSNLPECAGCAKCCKGLNVPITEGVDNISEEFTRYYFGKRHMKRLENGDCIMLNDKNLCSIYENRPKICKDFERGNPMCRNLFKD